MVRCFLWSCLYTQGDTSLTLFFLAFLEGMCLSWICSDFFPKVYLFERDRDRESWGGAEEVGERVSRQLCAEHAAQCRARSHDHGDPDHNLSWNRVRSSINCTTQMPLFNFLKSCPIRRIWRKRQKCQITTFLQFYYCYSRSALALE